MQPVALLWPRSGTTTGARLKVVGGDPRGPGASERRPSGFGTKADFQFKIEVFENAAAIIPH